MNRISPERRWLALDVSNLAYMAVYAFGDLSYEGAGTGAAFGILRNVLELTELYSVDGVVFCFDRGYGVRKKIYQEYKGNRREIRKRDESVDEKREIRRAVTRQLYRLRTRYLPDMGFKNVLWQDDYEADDIIASVCLGLGEGDEAIVVSTDGDMFQLLCQRVILWNPRKKKPVTEESFREEYKTDPALWPMVKAIAGCSSDNVRGVKGVGEKTAIKFLSGNLKPTTAAFQAIVKSNNKIKRNLKLVTLPFPGTKTFKLKKDKVTARNWDIIMEELGMKTLKGKWR